MYSTIVVPLDGSPFGERALPTAVALARRSDAALELVHVREHAARTPGAPVSDGRFDEEAEQLVRARVSSLADALAHDSRLTVMLAFLDGEIAVAVQAHVADCGADLVVMSSHGRGGFSRAWLGSVADELVRRSTAPILVVRPHPEKHVEGGSTAEPLFRRVLVPLDGSPRAEAVLTHAAALGAPGETEYLLLNVVTLRIPWDRVPSGALPPARDPRPEQPGDVQSRATAYLGCVADSFHEIGVRVTAHTMIHAQAGHAILDFARTHEVDLIVLSTRVRSVAERLLIGSVADKVLRGATAPVLLRGPRTRFASGGLKSASTTESVAASAMLTR